MKTGPPPTPELSLYLLGSFTLRAGDNRSIPDLRRKARALLAYLAAIQKPHTRHELAQLLCQEADSPLGTLRHLLSRLRAVLGPSALRVSGETVQLDMNQIWVDAYHFTQRLSTNPSELPLPTLAETIAMYRGEYVSGLYLSDAPEFELWLLGYRTHLHHLYERGALLLLDRYIAQSQFERDVLNVAIPLAQQLVQQNPLLEEAHYKLIFLYAQTNQRNAALDQYEHCRQLLADELAVEPMPALVALHAEVLSGRLRSPSPSLPEVLETPTWTATADFVGREKEFAQLQAAWAATEQGQTPLVLITAEAGGGKTRLVEEFLATIPHMVSLVGQCYESTRALAYQPWTHLLEGLLTQLDEARWCTLPTPWLDELARLLPGLALKQVSKTSSKQEQLFAAVVALLRLWEQPAVLFLDDLQWADAASLQLFHYVSERIAVSERVSAPLLLIGAYRSEEAEDNAALLTLLRDWTRREQVTRLQLPPLSSDAIEQLLTQLWPQLPSGYRNPHLRDRLHQATRGNPLFIGEIVRELTSTSHVPNDLPVPPSLRDLIQRRLHQLPSSGRQVLESLAVLEKPAPFDLVRQISARSEEEMMQALDLGLRWRLLHTDPISNLLEFQHDLMRQAVSQQLTGIRRQLLHRRTALALSQQGAKAATLAYHWHLAGDIAQEAIYAVQAGEEAAAVYAHQEAIRYLEFALPHLKKSEYQLRALLQLGRVWQVTSQWDRAETTYQQAMELAVAANNPSAIAQCQTAFGRLLRLKGEYEQAIQMLQKAETGFTTLKDSQGLNLVYGGLGAIYWSQYQPDQAIIYFEKQLQNAHQNRDALNESAALGSLGVVHTEIGQFAQAWPYFQQQLEIDFAHQNRLGVTKGIGNMGMMYAAQGQFAQALACYEYLLQTALELGDRLMVSVGVGNMVDIYLAQGHFSLAERLSEQAIVLTKKLNLPLYLCGYLHAFAKVRFAQKRFASSQALNEEALVVAGEVGRQDIIFSAQILAIKLQVALDRTSKTTALSQLRDMLSQWGENNEQAAILTEICQLDPTQTEERQRAATLYQTLYQQSPNVDYRQQYATLTGGALPDPPPVPPPPALVVERRPDLDSLLQQVDQLQA